MAPEPGRRAGLVATVVVVAALGGAVALTEAFVAPAHRVTAIRLLAGFVLLVAVSRVRAIVRAAVERRPSWGAAEAAEARALRPFTDARLARFRDEIRFSARSQSYFEHLLWPRLVALARDRGGSPETLVKPPARRFGRGPSVAALSRVVASLEARR
ncbi:MAG TPA: hypothetical protein VIF11_03665 [Methylomirabilota bacterium]